MDKNTAERKKGARDRPEKEGGGCVEGGREEREGTETSTETADAGAVED